MFAVKKTFQFQNGNYSEVIWDILLEKKEIYLPLLSENITQISDLLDKVKTLSTQLYLLNMLITKDTVKINDNTLEITLVFTDEESWNSYVNAYLSFGYDVSFPLDIPGVVSEKINYEIIDDNKIISRYIDN